MESIERYLNLSFEARAIPGLKADFTGPTKRKGPSKGKPKPKAAVVAKPKEKVRERERKNIGKRRVATSAVATDAGFAPPRGKLPSGG